MHTVPGYRDEGGGSRIHINTNIKRAVKEVVVVVVLVAVLQEHNTYLSTGNAAPWMSLVISICPQKKGVGV